MELVENVENGITIRLDLQPKVDTVRELRAERAALAQAAGVDYREFSFDVNPVGSTVRARWVFSAVDAGSEDTKPYVHVMPMSRNRPRWSAGPRRRRWPSGSATTP